MLVQSNVPFNKLREYRAVNTWSGFICQDQEYCLNPQIDITAIDFSEF